MHSVIQHALTRLHELYGGLLMKLQQETRWALCSS